MEENTFPENHAIAIQKDITTILTKMGSMETKIGGMEGKIGTIETKIGSMEAKIGGMEGKIGTMEANMATKEDLRKFATLTDVREIVSDAKNEILKETDRLRGRMARVEAKVGIELGT